MNNLHIMYMGAKVKPEYTGRLLGFVDDEQFAKLKKNEELREKILTSETIPFLQLYEKITKLSGWRIVMSIAKRDETHVHKTLLITEKIKDFTYSSPKEVGIQTHETGEWFTATEIEQDK